MTTKKLPARYLRSARLFALALAIVEDNTAVNPDKTAVLYMHEGKSIRGNYLIKFSDQSDLQYDFHKMTQKCRAFLPRSSLTRGQVIVESRYSESEIVRMIRDFLETQQANFGLMGIKPSPRGKTLNLPSPILHPDRWDMLQNFMSRFLGEEEDFYRVGLKLDETHINLHLPQWDFEAKHLTVRSLKGHLNSEITRFMRSLLSDAQNQILEHFCKHLNVNIEGCKIDSEDLRDLLNENSDTLGLMRMDSALVELIRQLELLEKNKDQMENRLPEFLVSDSQQRRAASRILAKIIRQKEEQQPLLAQVQS